jgi:tryptophanyl-tRNA synthetase
VDCKKILAESIDLNLKPFQEKRAALAAKPGYVSQVLADGANRAEAIAEETLKEVKEKMDLLQRTDLEQLR